MTGGPAAGDLGEPEDMGGDPACWLDRVCPECGGFMEDEAGHECRPAAGAPTPP